MRRERGRRREIEREREIERGGEGQMGRERGKKGVYEASSPPRQTCPWVGGTCHR